MTDTPTFTAFLGERAVASGDLATMLAEAKKVLDARGMTAGPLLVFEDGTGRQLDFDFSGSLAEVLERATPARGPGRPKLGVVSREVSLLPRHWEWLERQPQGISGALRRLVDEARKRAPAEERAREARDAASKIMWSLAGDLEGFEEASRALFAGDERAFEKLVRPWPRDIKAYVRRIAKPSFVRGEDSDEGNLPEA